MHTPEQDDTSYERMARQLAGEASELERAAFERSLADVEVHAAFEAVATVWRESALPAADVEAGWAKLHKRLGQHPSEVTSGADRAPKALWWYSTGGILRAAAVGLIVVTGGLIWSRARASSPASGEGAPSVLVASTGVAQRSQLRLPDGTEVQLGAASSLRTLPAYGTTTREVELVGEAAFHVIHDDAKPFRVRTAGAMVEDLGTRFVVRAIGREPVRVAVTEGSVSVGRSGAPRDRHAILQARDVAVVEDTGDVVVTRDVDVTPYTAWATGRVVLPFSHQSLRGAIVELERWYDVDFNVTDASLLNRTFSVTFEDKSIDEVLDVLGTALGVRFERSGRVVRVAAAERTGLAPSPVPLVGGGA